MTDVIVLVAILLASGGATIYLWRLYLSDEKPRSWVLWTIAIAASVCLSAGFWFAVLVGLRLSGMLELPAWTRPISYVVVSLLLLLPVGFAVQVERRRFAARMAARKQADPVRSPDDEVGSPL